MMLHRVCCSSEVTIRQEKQDLRLEVRRQVCSDNDKLDGSSQLLCKP